MYDFANSVYTTTVVTAIFNAYFVAVVAATACLYWVGPGDVVRAMKLAAVAGPMTYGLVTWLSGGNHRLALAITGLYFVGGLILLIGIDEKRGRASAHAD